MRCRWSLRWHFISSFVISKQFYKRNRKKDVNRLIQITISRNPIHSQAYTSNAPVLNKEKWIKVEKTNLSIASSFSQVQIYIFGSVLSQLLLAKRRKHQNDSNWKIRHQKNNRLLNHQYQLINFLKPLVSVSEQEIHVDRNCTHS